MMKKTNTLLASAVAVGVLMMAAQGAAAADKAPAAKAPAAKAPASNAAASAIEQRMKMMEEQMQMMRSELTRVRSEAAKPAESSAKLEDRVAKLETSEVVTGKKHTHTMLFFRGGFAHNDRNREGISISDPSAGLSNNTAGGLNALTSPQDAPDHDGYYIGAGFDYSLTNNVWGLLNSTPLNNTEVLAELMFEYKLFDPSVRSNRLVDGTVVNVLTGLPNDGNNRHVTVNQLTLSASPKIKFLEGSDFRPWIIPFGLAIHVVSPPSNSITVLNPGIMFGAGADYKIWKDFYVGADARYHLTSQDADGVNTDGLTAGGYVGIGF